MRAWTALWRSALAEERPGSHFSRRQEPKWSLPEATPSAEEEEARAEDAHGARVHTALEEGAAGVNASLTPRALISEHLWCFRCPRSPQ